MSIYRLLLIISLSLFTYSLGLSQSMLKEGNQWNVLSRSTLGTQQSTALIRVFGDTIINNETYTTFISTRDTIGEDWRKLNVFVREDTTGKVFLREGNVEEILLFDFGLEVGGTYVRERYGNVCNLEVMEVDSITLNNGGLRKRLQLVEEVHKFRYTWIEGIGAEFGPFFMDYCLLDVNTFLLCFSEQDELLYPDNPEFCFRTTSVQSVLPSDLEIYPNPIHNTIRIEYSETIIESYTLVNAMGQEILKGTLTGGSIDVSNVPAGTFVLLLRTRDGGVFSKKMIKLD